MAESGTHLEQGRIDAVARRLYREFMAEDYDEFPWDDENMPSNETVEEAQRLATVTIKALDKFEDGLVRHGDDLRNAVLLVLRHFKDWQHGGGYAPLGPQEQADHDVRVLQEALKGKPCT